MTKINPLFLGSFAEVGKWTEKAMAPHSSILAWKIPWTEEPGRLRSMGSWRAGHDWVTSLSLFTFMHWRRKWQPTPVFLPGEPRDRGAWWAAVYGVTQSRTRLKWLSSSSREMESWTNHCSTRQCVWQNEFHSLCFFCTCVCWNNCYVLLPLKDVSFTTRLWGSYQWRAVFNSLSYF